MCSKNGARTSPRKGQREQISVALVRAIRTRDCTLAARVRSVERYCRGRNGERHRDGWRIESDVVRAARKDITAERGACCGTKKRNIRRRRRRDFDEKDRRVAKDCWLRVREKDGGKIEEPLRKENI